MIYLFGTIGGILAILGICYSLIRFGRHLERERITGKDAEAANKYLEGIVLERDKIHAFYQDQISHHVNNWNVVSGLPEEADKPVDIPQAAMQSRH